MSERLSSGLESEIVKLGEKHNIDELRQLISNTATKSLIAIITEKIERNEFISFWNCFLLGFDGSSSLEMREKRFACVRSFLDGLLKVELPYKQTYDLVNRLCQDLGTFTDEQLIEVIEHCLDGLRAGDPKCVSWKDLLPEALGVLCGGPMQQQQHLNVNGVRMSGVEYRSTTIRALCTLKWPKPVLTPIADMFRNLSLNSAETVIVLNKFAMALQSLTPSELPALAYQLFCLCSTGSQIMIPILAFEKFFYRFYYKRLFADMESMTTDFDSIDEFSDKELREAEETVLHHLNYCTQYKISELQMASVLKNFIAMPDLILTPFVLSALLCMSAANRDPNSRLCLSSSHLLFFIRQVIKHNEEERSLSNCSVWCRDSLQQKQVNLEHVFTVLINQNKEGKDVITPGLVNLAFLLLKAKQSPALHSLAHNFLIKFIRKRFLFGQGIVRKVAEWMIIEQEQSQFAECLTLLSVSDAFTVSECVKTINYVMDFFLWIPGDQAMRMMSFILPILKISSIVRDAFLEILRKAILSSNLKTRRMAVYGLTMVLKQLNANNSSRSQLSGVSGICTQHSMSGYSLMSQSSHLSNRSNSQRNFDMLTLEIIGMLRSCFQQSIEIKVTLYENLQRAVELNPKLVSHVLQYIDWHFRSYFNAPANDAATAVNAAGDDDDDDLDHSDRFVLKFDKAVLSKDEMDMEIEITDNLGRLTLFVSHCLLIFESQGSTDYDTREMKRLLNLAIEKIINKEVKLEDGTEGTFSHLRRELIAQQLNFIEALMAYRLMTSSQDNDNVKHILSLFKQYRRLCEGLKTLASSGKKSYKKTKVDAIDNESSSSNATINGVAIKKAKVDAQVDNIWDLPVIEKFMRLLHEDVVPFATAQNCSSLRSNVDLVRYVLEVATAKVIAIRHEPEYKQITHSRRTLKYLTDITKVVYERCVKRLPSLWRDFDVKTAALAAECFRQCLTTANEVYKQKFSDVFVKGFDLHTVNSCREAPVVVQEILDECMKENDDSINTTVHAESSRAIRKHDSLSCNPDGKRIPLALLQALEIFYDNISYGNRLATDSYTWLLRFCQAYELPNKDLSLVFKLLFTQRLKTHSGAFFNVVAEQIGRVFGRQEESDDEDGSDDNDTEGHGAITSGPFGQLKSITLGSAESCLIFLYATLTNQIQDVEYFINKANSLSYKCRIIPEEDRDMSHTMLRALERSICVQLGHISNALLKLTNVCIPLGTCMNSLLKLLMQHYICLKNLARHFLSCCGYMKVTIQGLKFDQLLHVVGKPLPKNIYTLISYIEANIFDDEHKRKSNPQAQKAKVLRETKFIPKMVLCLENFNKHVILLSKKTNSRLANFLHIGIVRDFRIKTPELKAAIEKTLTHSQSLEVATSVSDESSKGGGITNDVEGLEDLDQANEAENNDNDTMLQRLEAELAELDGPHPAEGVEVESNKENANLDLTPDDIEADLNSQAISAPTNERSKVTNEKSKEMSKRAKPQETKKGKPGPKSKKKLLNPLVEEIRTPPPTHSTSSTPDSVEHLQGESEKASHSQLMQNLDEINKRARKRSMRDTANVERDSSPPSAVPPPEAKKRCRRPSRK